MNTGGLLQLEDKWAIWTGPLETVSIENNKDFFIYVRQFFDKKSQIYKPKAWKVLPTSDLSGALELQLHTLQSSLVSSSVSSPNSDTQNAKEHQKSAPFHKPIHFNNSDSLWENPSYESFENSFRQIEKYFKSGSLEKIVPIVFAKRKSPLSTIEKLNSILKVINAPFPLMGYGFWSENFGFIGASPELLFNQSKGSIRSMALAGTSSKEVPHDSFLKDLKERKEHNLVIQDLIQSLSQFGNTQVSATEVLSLPNLNHLKTEIFCKLKNEFKTDEIITALHPSSALGTSPHSFWTKMLELPEQKERCYFGSPFGISYPSEGKRISRILVGIRQVQWDDQGLKIGAGCGVIPSSQLEREWSEVNLKINSVKRLMGWIT